MHSRSILILAATLGSASGAEITVYDGGKLIVKSQITAAGGGVLVESGGELQLDGVANTAVEVAAGGLLDIGCSFGYVSLTANENAPGPGPSSRMIPRVFRPRTPFISGFRSCLKRA